MSIQKTVAAIHDISGLGKCSLTAALPVLSAAGASVGVLPTAILSTQTGGLNEYTYRDLTQDMPGVMAHWQKLGVTFDAVYSGFLGSTRQAQLVGDFVDAFSPGGIFLCDPAMADGGALYDTFDDSFVEAMAGLCKKADIIVPNMTEAAMLLGEAYLEPPYSREYINRIITDLSRCLGVRQTVITGVHFDSQAVGVAALDSETGELTYALRPLIPGMFHSTGDLFASALLGGILRGLSLSAACNAAMNFTVEAIKLTVKTGGDSRFGLCFEMCLPGYMKELGIV